jgi:hypothetical protein
VGTIRFTRFSDALDPDRQVQYEKPKKPGSIHDFSPATDNLKKMKTQQGEVIHAR